MSHDTDVSILLAAIQNIQSELAAVRAENAEIRVENAERDRQLREHMAWEEHALRDAFPSGPKAHHDWHAARDLADREKAELFKAVRLKFAERGIAVMMWSLGAVFLAGLLVSVKQWLGLK